MSAMPDTTYNDGAYNYAYLDEQTKRMIRRAILKAVAVPGYQVPFGGREMPLPYGWGTGGIQVTAAIIGQDDTLKGLIANRTQIVGNEESLKDPPFPLETLLI